MRSRPITTLLLLLILCFDIPVSAKTASGNAAFNLDGIPAAQRRHKLRRHRISRRRSEATGNRAGGDGGGGAAPPTAEPPVGAAPPPPARKAAPPIDVNKPGGPKPNAAPGIKPPTVQIKPPTR